LETKNHPFGIKIQEVRFGPPLQASSDLHNESTITMWSWRLWSSTST
jgi:hypothetical protein